MLLATGAARFSASVTPAVCPAFFGEVSLDDCLEELKGLLEG